MKKQIFTLMTVCLMSMNLMAQFKCVKWIKMENEPAYATTTYERGEYVAAPTPTDWTYDAASLDFDAAWTILGDNVESITNPTNVKGGDPFEAGVCEAKWGAMYDDANLYVFVNWIGSNKVDAGTQQLEVIYQPTEIVRYEDDFIAADTSVILQNHSYARFVELGGAKIVANASGILEANASIGRTGEWGANANATTEMVLASALQYWNEDADAGTIKAVVVIPFTALSYQTNPLDSVASPELTPLTIVPGETKISWDIKNNGKIGGTTGAFNVHYMWHSDKNQGFAVNYYNGFLKFGERAVGVNSTVANNNIKVYCSNDMLNIKGIDNSNVAVYNISGKLVKTTQNVNGKVSMSNLPKGLYLVRLNNNSKAYKVSKF